MRLSQRCSMERMKADEWSNSVHRLEEILGWNTLTKEQKAIVVYVCVSQHDNVLLGPEIALSIEKMCALARIEVPLEYIKGIAEGELGEEKHPHLTLVPYKPRAI